VLVHPLGAGRSPTDELGKKRRMTQFILRPRFIGFSSSDSYCLWYIQQRKLSLSPFEQHGMPFSLVVAESDILPIDVPVARLQLSDQRTFGYLPAPQKTVRTDIIGKCGK